MGRAAGEQVQEQGLQPCWQSKWREEGCHVLIPKAMNFKGMIGCKTSCKNRKQLRKRPH